MRKIEGFENYLVDSSGKVFSLRSNKYLKLQIIGGGYYVIGLYHNGNQYYKYISRLVAQAFILNPDNKSEVNHKDGNKANNDKSNLEWVTHKENIQHAIKTGLFNRIAINVYDYKTGEFKSTHSSMSDTARFYGISIGNISTMLKGRIKQTNGLTFVKIFA